MFLIYRSFGEVSNACDHGYAARRLNSWEVNEVATVMGLILLKNDFPDWGVSPSVCCEWVLDATKKHLFMIQVICESMDLRCCTTIIIQACILINLFFISLTDCAQPVVTPSLQTSVLQSMYSKYFKYGVFFALPSLLSRRV